MKIGKRLAFGFGFVLLALMLTTAFSLYQLGKVANATRTMLEKPLAKERVISDWSRIVFAGVQRTTAIAKSKDPALDEYFSSTTTEAIRAGGELAKQAEDLATDEDRKIFEDLKSVRKKFLDSRDLIRTLKKEERYAEADRIFENVFTPFATAYDQSIKQLVVLQRRSIDSTAQQINEITVTSRNIQLTLAILVALLCTIFSIWLSKGITKPLSDGLEVAKSVAAGDLTKSTSIGKEFGEDEAGQLKKALSVMGDSLTKIVLEVREASDAISLESTQIAAGNIELSERTEQQASALKVTAASMDALTLIVRKNADNARQATEVTESASGVASKGGVVMSSVIDTMEEINKASIEISDIISVIDGIAFQTNILALNAAVEAARAGEQGRGFAVVAAEVRNLAQRSATAAKEIKLLIGATVERIGVGSDLVQKAGHTMTEIVDSVRHVTNIMEKIAVANEEQTAAIESAGQAVSQIDKTTQQNAALVKEAATAAQSMKDRTTQLSRSIAIFKLAN